MNIIERIDKRENTLFLIANMALHDLSGIVQFDIGALLLEEDGELVVAATKGIKESQITSHRIPIDASLSGALFQHFSPRRFSSVEKELDLKSDENLEPYYSGPLISVPIGGVMGRFGLLNLCRSEGKKPFTDEELAKVSTYATEIAYSISCQQLVDVKTAELEAVRAELEKVNNRLKEDVAARVEAERKIQCQYEEIQRQYEELNAAKKELERKNEELLDATLKLQESEEKYRVLVEKAGDGIVIVSDGSISYANPRFMAIVGKEEGEIVGARFEDFIEDRDGERIKKYLYCGETAEKEGMIIETRMVGENRVVDVEMTTTPILYNDDLALLIFIRDVTERNNLQRQLAQSQKLESIGRLAAGIAHEINTPTQYVGDNVRFLSEAFEDLFRLLDRYEEVVGEGEKGELEVLKEEVDLEYLREEVPRAIEQSLDGVERVTKIVRSMKEFSHPGGGGKELVDLNRAIESTVTVARNEWKYVADLELDLEEGLPPVPCYVGEFNQVVLNLVINAVHAIEEVVGDGSEGKGKIVVSTRRVGEWVEVRVSDTGCGIPEEVREKVFEPFFTTKGVGKGTGQGLAIARSVVVDKHGGEIDFESEVGKGTTFIIRLPLNVGENSIGGEKSNRENETGDKQ